MMHTENEAKTKWCPYALTFGSMRHYRDDEEVGVSHGPQNRGYQMGQASSNCMCLASGCMVWRWGEAPVFERKTGHASPEGDGWIEVEEGLWQREHPHMRRGLCGLAGKTDRRA
jgi:hypothetical protein